MTPPAISTGQVRSVRYLVLAVLVILVFWYRQRRGALNPDEPKVTDPGPFRIIRRRIPREGPLYAIGLAGFAAYLAWLLTVVGRGSWSFGPLLRIAFIASRLTLIALLTVSWTSIAWIYRDHAGDQIGMLLWHTDGDGTIWVDGRAGGRPQDLALELADLAQHLGQSVTVSGRHSALGRQLSKTGHPVSGRGISARIVVQPAAETPSITDQSGPPIAPTQ